MSAKSQYLQGSQTTATAETANVPRINELFRDCTPSLSQAVRMKKLSQDVKLTPEVIFSIMTEETANQKERLKLPMNNLRKYFPKRYTPEEIEVEIMRMLEDRYRRRERERDDR